MDVGVAIKLTVFMMGLGFAAVVVDGLARRATGAKASPLSVALPRGFVVVAAGLILFAIALQFDPHPWLLFGLPALAMGLVHRAMRRREKQPADPGAVPLSDDPPAANDPSKEPSTLQTLISIAIAFALAFTIRHLVLEAFTVPLSALAPTILGHHFDVVCDRCGGRFTEMTLGVQPPAAMPCPGCGGPVRIDGGMKSPDRVLVEKLSEPSRWDLAVFEPADPDPELPGKIMSRIVGLPGEMIELGLGDVFIDGQRLVKPADRLEQLWFLIGDTSWGGAGKPLNGWVGETDDRGPLLRYAHAVTAPLMTHVDEQTLEIRVAPRPVRDICLVVDFAQPHAGAVEVGWSAGEQQAVLKSDGGNSVMLRVGEETRSFTSAAKSSVGLAVRDGIVSALADGRLIGTCPLESQSSADHVERARSPMPPCALTVRAPAAPRRIRLWRDVHYFTDADAAEPVVRARLGEPFKLAGNSYFVLGDDSGLAGDSRTITKVAPQHQAHCQLGTLSRTLFVGVVRWIYWPITRADSRNVR